MITLMAISKKIGARTLFEEVNVVFTKGNRYGLTGPNGSGKSTLMRLIAKVEEPTSGSVFLPNKVGFLQQNVEKFKDHLVLDTVIMGNQRLWRAIQERDDLSEKEPRDVGLRLGELAEIIEEEDGYSAESNGEELLIGMGVPEKFYQKKMDSIPTDMQFRVLLCQALFGSPEALLLDEPTNHLDLESIGWLEQFLLNYKGILIVTSHDRHFLNTITTHTADIDYETLIVYPTAYDQMVLTKTAIRTRIEEENRSKQKKISQLQEFVAKFGAGTRASQVQSRIREIDRLKPIEAKQSNIQRPYIRFCNVEKKSGQIVLKAENISKGYGEQLVINNFSLEISIGDKIGVVGNNGSGKTTLLKMLAGAISPDSGMIQKGHQVEIGYFPQNHEDVVDKKIEESLFEWLKKQKKNSYDQEIRNVLGKMLFGGDDSFKLTRSLSGGETARIILAGLMLRSCNLLILDEPNNHLDLESVDALATALKEFKGAVIIASHNRNLLNEISNKIIAFDHGKISTSNQSLEEYLSNSTQRRKKL